VIDHEHDGVLGRSEEAADGAGHGEGGSSGARLGGEEDSDA
jgi:hypothetical protein